MSYVVYMHTAPNGKIYIGITNRKPEIRWGKNGNGYKRNAHFASAIKKYGWDAIKHEVLFSDLSKEKACKIEQLLIEKYDATNRLYGFNISKGGESGSYGVKASDETRKRQSEAHKGKKLSEEHKKHLSESHKGYGHGGFTKGRVVSESTKEKNAEKHSIPIVCLQTGEVFKNSVEASEKMNLCKSAICMTLKGTRKHTKGYRFAYVSEVQNA